MELVILCESQNKKSTKSEIGSDLLQYRMQLIVMAPKFIIIIIENNAIIIFRVHLLVGIFRMSLSRYGIDLDLINGTD